MTVKKSRNHYKRVPPEAGIIGANLRALRVKAGQPQLALANALRVSFQQIQKYEKGVNRLPIEKLYILKHYYDVPYERFFEGLERLQ